MKASSKFPACESGQVETLVVCNPQEVCTESAYNTVAFTRFGTCELSDECFALQSHFECEQLLLFGFERHCPPYMSTTVFNSVLNHSLANMINSAYDKSTTMFGWEKHKPKID